MRTRPLYVRVPLEVHNQLLEEAAAEGEQLAVIIRRRLRNSLIQNPPTQPEPQTQEE